MHNAECIIVRVDEIVFSHFFCTEKPFTKNISITSFSQYTTICFVSFVYSVFNEHLRRMEFALVGPSGLEPPTSCLSGTRSNLLSYEPMWLVCDSFTLRFSASLLQEVTLVTFLFKESNWWRWWDSNPWPPACRAGALPAELHPHKGFCFFSVNSV